MTHLLLVLTLTAAGAAPVADAAPVAVAARAAVAAAAPVADADADAVAAPVADAAPVAVAAPAADAARASLRAFADHLSSTGDHYRAIGEYQRYLFHFPAAPDAASARLAIGRAYLLGGRPADAAAFFDALAEAERDPALNGAWRWYAALCRVEDRDPTALEDLEAAARALPKKRARAALLTGLVLARAGDDEGALLSLRRASSEPALADEARAIEARVSSFADELPDKSPLLAGTLSAILPGAGHAYVGEWGLAFAALGWNALFGLGIYETVDQELWGLTAALAGVGSIFYLGGITGAASAAHRVNRDARIAATDALVSEHPLMDPRTPEPAAVVPR